MPSPARTGVLIYAKEVAILSRFYEQVLGARLVHGDDSYRILQSPDTQLIIHSIPEPFRSSISLTVPPEPREDQAIKPFFTVDSLEIAERTATACGGGSFGPIWPGPGMRVRNAFDPGGEHCAFARAIGTGIGIVNDHLDPRISDD